MPLDKAAHFLAGISIVAVLWPFGILVAGSWLIILAVGKEVWDAQGHGTPDPLDAIATLLGGVLMAAWFTLMNY